MSLKAFVKNVIPDSLTNRIHNNRVKKGLVKAADRDAERFFTYYSGDNPSTIGQIESQLIFYIHQIEKGFSFDSYQYGRGKSALRHIATLVNRLSCIDSNWSTNPVYLDAIQTLGEYRRRHVESGYDISYMSQIFSSEMSKEIKEASQEEYPSISISRSSKDDNSQASFKELVQRRHAVRSYAKQAVSRDELVSAIELALRTPSVCNRQPSRVRIYTDKDVIVKALKIQGGFSGYDTPPALMLITADLQSFIATNERNEAYVDGGLFAMSLLYSLEANNLAACPLNTMFNKKTNAETRELLHIPDNEVFIMYIAVGHFQETSKICLSKRLGIDHILMN